MTDMIALKRLEALQVELGKKGYSLAHRDFTLQPLEIREIQAVDETYIILYADKPIIVRSELGVYDHYSETQAENMHTHTGVLLIENHCDECAKDVEFLQAIWH